MNALKRLHHASKRTRAQTMVEFALALPIILMLLFGLLEAGRLLFFYSSVFTASREGARYGSAAGLAPDGVNLRFRDCTGIRDAAKRLGTFVGVTDGSVAIRYDNGPSDARAWGSLPGCPSDTSLGQRVIVRVSVNYTPIVPLINWGSFPITSTTARTILKDIEVGGNSGVVAPTWTLAAQTTTPTPTTAGGGGGGGSPTVTPTPTATVEPAVDCTKMRVVAGPITSNNKYSFDIKNETGEDTDVTVMSVSWATGETLESIMMGSVTVWSGGKTSVANGFSWSGDISLNNGATKSFIYSFSKNVMNGSVQATINFANGCSIRR